jgi:hypothetical protein
LETYFHVQDTVVCVNSPAFVAAWKMAKEQCTTFEKLLNFKPSSTHVASKEVKRNTSINPDSNDGCNAKRQCVSNTGISSTGAAVSKNDTGPPVSASLEPPSVGAVATGAKHGNAAAHNHADNDMTVEDETPLEEVLTDYDRLQIKYTQMVADRDNYERTIKTMSDRVAEVKEEKENTYSKLKKCQTMLEDKDKTIQAQDKTIQAQEKRIQEQGLKIEELGRANTSLESKFGASDAAHRAKARSVHIRQKAALDELMSSLGELEEVIGCGVDKDKDTMNKL